MDKRGLLGVVLDGQYMPDASAEGRPEGVRISEIQPGLAADRADLNAGDVVLSVNTQKVSSVRELQVVIASKKPGTEVTLTISRGRSIFVRKVILGDWFDFLVRTPLFGPFSSDVSLRPLRDIDRESLGIPNGVNGLYVEDIADRSLYAFVFRKGMVITSVNGVELLSSSIFKRALNAESNTYRYYADGIYGSFTLLKD